MVPLLTTRDLHKFFILGDEKISVINGISLEVSYGDFVAVMGTSGSGKSTLMHILGGLIKPDSGQHHMQGKNMLDMGDTERSWVRAHWIGFVFQTFHLLPELNVVENVGLPFLYNHVDARTMQERIADAINRVGLTHRKNHRPSELSGGEMQRAAIARALVVDPLLILADEPTGNLDSKNSREILELFSELNEAGATIIMVTHDPQVAGIARQTLNMRDGLLFSSRNA